MCAPRNGATALRDEINLKRVRLVDHQALPGFQDVLPSMLAWGLEECRTQGIHMLEAFGFRPEKQQIIDNDWKQYQEWLLK